MTIVQYTRRKYIIKTSFLKEYKPGLSFTFLVYKKTNYLLVKIMLTIHTWTANRFNMLGREYISNSTLIWDR